ncbi:MAG: hypothetical protein HYV07_00085 [Deltaproteobacteria bacterium]|nr:hypothetical protein [Deltaproteobacteria bacterium]
MVESPDGPSGRSLYIGGVWVAGFADDETALAEARSRVAALTADVNTTTHVRLHAGRAVVELVAPGVIVRWPVVGPCSPKLVDRPTKADPQSANGEPGMHWRCGRTLLRTEPLGEVEWTHTGDDADWGDPTCECECEPEPRVQSGDFCPRCGGRFIPWGR